MWGDCLANHLADTLVLVVALREGILVGAVREPPIKWLGLEWHDFLLLRPCDVVCDICVLRELDCLLLRHAQERGVEPRRTARKLLILNGTAQRSRKRRRVMALLRDLAREDNDLVVVDVDV